MQNRTDPPSLGLAPPPFGAYPYLPTFEEWVVPGSVTPVSTLPNYSTLVIVESTLSYLPLQSLFKYWPPWLASSAFPTGVGGSTPASESPDTPIWQGGAGLGGAQGNDPSLGR